MKKPIYSALGIFLILIISLFLISCSSVLKETGYYRYSYFAPNFNSTNQIISLKETEKFIGSNSDGAKYQIISIDLENFEEDVLLNVNEVISKFSSKVIINNDFSYFVILNGDKTLNIYGKNKNFNQISLNNSAYAVQFNPSSNLIAVSYQDSIDIKDTQGDNIITINSGKSFIWSANNMGYFVNNNQQLIRFNTDNKKETLVTNFAKDLDLIKAHNEKIYTTTSNIIGQYSLTDSSYIETTYDFDPASYDLNDISTASENILLSNYNGIYTLNKSESTLIPIKTEWISNY